MSSNKQYPAGGILSVDTDIFFPTIPPPSPKPHSCSLQHSKFAKFFTEKDPYQRLPGLMRNKPASVDLGAPYTIANEAIAVHGSGVKSFRFGRVHYDYSM